MKTVVDILAMLLVSVTVSTPRMGWIDVCDYFTNSTDNCLTYYYNGKDPCNGATFDVDSKNDGLNGSETITYCNTEDYSNMVYIDDLSGHGTSLLSSQTRLIITSSQGTEKILLNPSEVVDVEGKRYCLVDCLFTTNLEHFDFTPVNKSKVKFETSVPMIIITNYLETQFNKFLEVESRVSRVGVCLYFIAPTGHGLRQVDLKFLRRLHNKVRSDWYFVSFINLFLSTYVGQHHSCHG